MTDYLQSLLPRIRQFSKQLNDEANFVEIPWAFMDEEGAKVTYIFRRNNELLVSRHGDVATGRWEYLPVVQSLLIEYQGGKRLYNQGFLDNAVMVLRKDGTEELFALANMQKIPDLDVVKHLEQWTAQNTQISDPKLKTTELMLKNGARVILESSNPNYSGYYKCRITYKDSAMPLPNGKYELDNDVELWVQEGKVNMVRTKEEKVAGIFFGILLLGFALVLIFQVLSILFK